MELFHKAKAVRLQSHHGKYLTADEDEESVTQDRNGSSKNAKWTVEFVEKTDNVIRLKSCYGKYLTASNQPFLLGMTGRKVLQTVPNRLDSSIEWEPIREGHQVKLRTRYGQFLRGNGGLPPWRNSVTHDIPHRTSTQDWILWDVHVVEILVHHSPVSKPPPPLVNHSDSFASESSSPSTGSSKSLSFSRQETYHHTQPNTTQHPYITYLLMELFYDAKAVRFRSHLNKYLVADDDQKNIRQSRNGSSRKARWLVELVAGNSHLIRLKSSSGMYLTASDEPFLLSMTGGKKVLQTLPANMADANIEWEPLRYGFQVKLRGYGGKFLSASGAPLRWTNRVTHDCPYSATTHNWILWSVEPVDIPEDESLTDYLTMVSNFSSVSGELSTLDLGSPMSMYSSHCFSPKSPLTRRPAMELFHKAKAVRLQSHHYKYLTALEDEESVTQDRDGASRNAKWTIEFVENTNNIIRLKSCYGKYLTASNQSSVLGITGRKVVQTLPNRLDSSVEWEPIREGNQVKLRTRYGQFLRGNGGLLPWKNSVTHDIPYRRVTQDWILWDVQVVENLLSPLAPREDSCVSESSSPSNVSSKSTSFSTQESSDSSLPNLGEGRFIFYHMVDEFGEIEEEKEALFITFDGNTVEELTKRLEDETGLEDIIVCTRSPLNGKLYPLSLHLPPNNATMNVIIMPSS
ncbi:hypothetical protein A4A49_62791, partial [Nicotiana attenuata]